MVAILNVYWLNGSISDGTCKIRQGNIIAKSLNSVDTFSGFKWAIGMILVVGNFDGHRDWAMLKPNEVYYSEAEAIEALKMRKF